MATLRTHRMIHATYTRTSYRMKPEDIPIWHMGPRDNLDDTVVFKGKQYSSRAQLPDDQFIYGHPIRNLKGNGWSKVGYECLILRNGNVIRYIDNDGDNFISSDEVTYGAAGTNNYTGHYALEGGMADSGELEFNFTTGQMKVLAGLCIAEITTNPDIKLIGHNQVHASKWCPVFYVPAWAASIGISNHNIDLNHYEKKNPFAKLFNSVDIDSMSYRLKS